MCKQVHEQWKLLKTNGKLKNDSDLTAYLILLELRRQERQANPTFHGPPFYKIQRFVKKIPHKHRAPLIKLQRRDKDELTKQRLDSLWRKKLAEATAPNIHFLCHLVVNSLLHVSKAMSSLFR